MRYEETEYWKVIIPATGTIDTWKAVIEGKVTGFSEMLPEYGENTEQKNVVVIACSEEVIKKILDATAKHFIQKCVVCYRISNKCIIGYNE